MSSSDKVAVPSKISREVEVVAKATRRRFTAEYKQKIPQEVDLPKARGDRGAAAARGTVLFESEDLAGTAA